MLRTLLFAALLTVCVGAHAGFLTGFVVGRVTAPDGSSSSTTGPATLVTSDHDTIVCINLYRDGNYTNLCRGDLAKSEWTAFTPNQFAGRLGYKTLYKTAVLVVADGTVLIVMEVSK